MCPFPHIQCFLKASTQRWSCWAAGYVWICSFIGCYHTALQSNRTKKNIFLPPVYENVYHSTSLSSIVSGSLIFAYLMAVKWLSRFNLCFPDSQGSRTSFHLYCLDIHFYELQIFLLAFLLLCKWSLCILWLWESYLISQLPIRGNNNTYFLEMISSWS